MTRRARNSLLVASARRVMSRRARNSLLVASARRVITGAGSLGSQLGRNIFVVIFESVLVLNSDSTLQNLMKSRLTNLETHTNIMVVVWCPGKSKNEVK